MKGLVLDLRFNPGGLLESSRQISELFVGRGRQIVEIKRPRKDQRDLLVAHAAGYDRTVFEMVVLVNGYSASASEIVSACLQDHNRALIVGERSYGKGSVQNIQPFEGGDLKLTTASFWRPNGRNLNKSSTDGKGSDGWGVVPTKGG